MLFRKSIGGQDAEKQDWLKNPKYSNYKLFGIEDIYYRYLLLLLLLLLHLLSLSQYY